VSRVTAGRGRTLVALIACSLVCGASALGRAQSTGGSFGGSHFGGGGGGGGGSSYRGGNTGYRAPSYGSAPSGGGSSSAPYVLTAADRARIDRDVARQREEAALRELDRQRARAQAAEQARLLTLPPSERARATAWTSDDAWPVSGTVATIWTAPGPDDPRARWGAARPAPEVTLSGWHAAQGPPERATGVGVALLGLLAVLLIAGPVELRAYLRRPLPASAEVRRVSLALDWTARRAIQSKLAELAKRTQTDSRSGLYEALSKTRALLEAHAGAVRYAGWQRSAERPPAVEAVFNRLAQDFRARFRIESVRNATTGAAPELRARADEGEGLVVVTIIVATATALAPLPAAAAPDVAVAALRTLTLPNPALLWALEVIWSPSTEDDRLSSAELEVLYPELARTDGRGDVGRTSCSFCSAAYPAELGRCPACGAPRA
jgi:uncharacterized membrane protein